MLEPSQNPAFAWTGWAQKCAATEGGEGTA